MVTPLEEFGVFAAVVGVFTLIFSLGTKDDMGPVKPWMVILAGFLLILSEARVTMVKAEFYRLAPNAYKAYWEGAQGPDRN
jgi:hypothetical protein